MQEEILNRKEAAKYLGVSIQTMCRWAGKGTGPRLIKYGDKMIRYRKKDLDEWMQSKELVNA